MPDELWSSQVLETLRAKYDVRTDREGLAAVADVFLPHELRRATTGQRCYLPHHIDVLGAIWNLQRELGIPMRSLLLLASSPAALEQVTTLARRAGRAKTLADQADGARSNRTEEAHAIAS